MTLLTHTPGPYKDVPRFSLPVVSEKTLKHVVLLHRHGDRMSVQDCGLTLKSSDGHVYVPGELTDRGKSQLQYLGTVFRTYLSHYKPYFNDLNPKTVKVRSTFIERAVMSAWSFLSTFLDETMTPDSFEVRKDSEENLLPGCSKMLDGYLEENRKKCDVAFLQNPKIVDLYQRYCRVYGLSYEEKEYSTAVITMCDTLNLYMCNECPLKVNEKGEALNQEDLAFSDKIGVLWFHYLVGLESTIAKFTNGFVGDILYDVQKSMFGTPKNDYIFHEYSSHDITLYMFLALLGYETDKWIPLASYIIIEFFEEKDKTLSVRFSYNSEVLKLKCANGNDFCGWETFKKYIENEISL
ncbi:hypothetical protein EIN_440260 [Entamoeba invadens IP1]|uniref:Acid phosphatase n=1 Tax=Entamoeba invadens IP1 TaxID=370355 RepID=A0A0A1TUT4_ENTIV|nr:hypothetical protein EIN_440260 [Entamoeba invadens IP1]ELP83892.1 hypothetical protein EIN_440260 [Entamoeba invadens IP1]|eukprot:XP_004183238.1 hypothetical protein EIN_440260 [Entamoeba invadens IP1]